MVLHFMVLVGLRSKLYPELMKTGRFIRFSDKKNLSVQQDVPVHFILWSNKLAECPKREGEISRSLITYCNRHPVHVREKIGDFSAQEWNQIINPVFTSLRVTNKAI